MLDELRAFFEAFALWGEHKPTCRWHKDQWDRGCDCGWRKMQNAAEDVAHRIRHKVESSNP